MNEIIFPRTEIILPQSLEIVQGMENIQGLMVSFATKSADVILEQIESGQDIAIGAFLNGAMLPIIYTLAELRRRNVPDDVYTKITDNILLMERIRILEDDKKVTQATLIDREPTDSPSIGILLDDIVETVETADDFQETFPNAQITIVSPIMKHVTNRVLSQRNYNCHILQAVSDDWIYSGCGMDASHEDPDARPYELARLSVLQRCADIGLFCKDLENKPKTADQIEFFQKRLLPWIAKFNFSPKTSFIDHLILMEISKMKKNYDAQFNFATQVFDRFRSMTTAEAESILALD